MSAVSLPMLEDRRSYVYAHAKATTGEIFYIGKGTGERAYRMKARSGWHKRVVAKHGVDVHILERNLTHNEAYARECVLLDEGRELGLELVNLCDGGGGVRNPHQSTRTKMSKKSKSRANTPEYLAWARDQKLGTKQSDKTKSKISAAGKGRKHSDETKAKMSVSGKARVLSQEARQSMSNAVAASNKRRVLTPEAREKLSVANKASWARRKAKQSEEKL